MEKPSLEERNLTQKHMAVSGRVLERPHQGLFESGPKNCILNLKI